MIPNFINYFPLFLASSRPLRKKLNKINATSPRTTTITATSILKMKSTPKDQSTKEIGSEKFRTKFGKISKRQGVILISGCSKTKSKTYKKKYPNRRLSIKAIKTISKNSVYPNKS